MGTTDSILASSNDDNDEGLATDPSKRTLTSSKEGTTTVTSAVTPRLRSLQPSSAPTKAVAATVSARDVSKKKICRLTGIVLGMSHSGKQALLQRMQGKNPFAQESTTKETVVDPVSPPSVRSSGTRKSIQHQKEQQQQQQLYSLATEIPYQSNQRIFHDSIQLRLTSSSSSTMSDVRTDQHDFAILMIHPGHDRDRLQDYVRESVSTYLRRQGYNTCGPSHDSSNDPSISADAAAATAQHEGIDQTQEQEIEILNRCNMKHENRTHKRCEEVENESSHTTKITTTTTSIPTPTPTPTSLADAVLASMQTPTPRPICLCILLNFRDLKTTVSQRNSQSNRNRSHSRSESDSSVSVDTSVTATPESEKIKRSWISKSIIQRWILHVLQEFPTVEPSSLILQISHACLVNCYGLHVLHSFIYQSYLKIQQVETESLLNKICVTAHHFQQQQQQTNVASYSYSMYVKAILRGDFPTRSTATTNTGNATRSTTNADKTRPKSQASLGRNPNDRAMSTRKISAKTTTGIPIHSTTTAASTSASSVTEIMNRELNLAKKPPASEASSSMNNMIPQDQIFSEAASREALEAFFIDDADDDEKESEVAGKSIDYLPAQPPLNDTFRRFSKLPDNDDENEDDDEFFVDCVVDRLPHTDQDTLEKSTLHQNEVHSNLTVLSSSEVSLEKCRIGNAASDLDNDHPTLNSPTFDLPTNARDVNRSTLKTASHTYPKYSDVMATPTCVDSLSAVIVRTDDMEPQRYSIPSDDYLREATSAADAYRANQNEHEPTLSDKSLQNDGIVDDATNASIHISSSTFTALDVADGKGILNSVSNDSDTDDFYVDVFTTTSALKRGVIDSERVKAASAMSEHDRKSSSLAATKQGSNDSQSLSDLSSAALAAIAEAQKEARRMLLDDHEHLKRKKKNKKKRKKEKGLRRKEYEL